MLAAENRWSGSESFSIGKQRVHNFFLLESDYYCLLHVDVESFGFLSAKIMAVQKISLSAKVLCLKLVFIVYRSFKNQVKVYVIIVY